MIDEFPKPRYEIRVQVIDNAVEKKHSAYYVERNPYAVRARLQVLAEDMLYQLLKDIE